jgi:hypothetical protein
MRSHTSTKPSSLK